MEVIEKHITYHSASVVNPDVFHIYPLGDIHLGAIGCAEHKIEAKVKEIAEQDNAYWIGMGDYVDAITKDDKRFSSGGLAPWVNPHDIIESQRKRAVELFMPIKDKGICMLAVSADTEVLTQTGWKTYDKLTIGEKVLSLNTETDKYEYTEIRGIYPNDYRGDICHIKTKSLDQLLTPDHRILYWNKYKTKYEYRRVLSLPTYTQHMSIPIAAPYTDGQFTSLSDDEVMFLAWVITEGHIDYKRSRNPVIEITQSLKSKYITELESLFTRLKLSSNKHYHKGRQTRTVESNWVCYYFPYKQCAKYIDILNGKREIPLCLLDLPLPQLNLLLNTLIKGDGCIAKTGGISYYTSSLTLAKQVVELCLKTGKSASLIVRNRKQQYNGYSKYTNTTGYTVFIHKWNRRQIAHRIMEPYSGKVFCLSTGNGNFVAMRNGKPFCTGNTGNHEEKAHDIHSDDIGKHICDDLGIPYAGYQAFIALTFDRENSNESHRYIIHAWHGDGAAQTEGARVMRLMRLVNEIEAQIYLMGHLHAITLYTPDRLVYRNGKVRNVELIAAMTGSWLKGYTQSPKDKPLPPNYIEKKGYKPSRIGCPIIHISPQTDTIYAQSS